MKGKTLLIMEFNIMTFTLLMAPAHPLKSLINFLTLLKIMMVFMRYIVKQALEELDPLSDAMQWSIIALMLLILLDGSDFAVQALS